MPFANADGERRPPLQPLAQVRWVETTRPAGCSLSTAVAAALQLALFGSALSILAPARTAHAQTSVESSTSPDIRTFNIPSGPLAGVLDRLARTAGVNLAYDAALVSGLTSNGLVGSFTVPTALSMLLAPSGLEVVVQPGGGFSLRKAAGPSAASTLAAPSATTLPAVRVRASSDRGLTKGYRAENTDAIAPGLSQQETPAVVNVMTSDFLKDAGASKLTDALSYVPGLTTADNVGSPTDRMTIRGFPLSAGALGVTGTYLNGMRQAVTSGQYRSLDNIERVEIVKGPAGVEASISDPGGFVNFITKKPSSEFGAEARIGFGDHGYRTVGVDVTGPIASVPQVQYRLIASHNELATWRPGRQDRPQDLIAPSLNWSYAPGSHVTLEFEQLKSNDTLDRGTIYVKGAGFDDDFAGRNWSIHQASDSMPATSRRFDLDWTHQLASGWQTKLRLQRMTQDQLTDAIRNNDTSGIYGADGLTWNGATTIPIYVSHDSTHLEAQTAELSLRGEFHTGTVENTLNVGLSKNRSRDTFASHDGDHVFRDNDNSVDLFAPNNDQVVNVIGTYLNGDFKRGSDLKSAFGQWVARWSSAWRTVFSVRRDNYDGFAVSETLDGTAPSYNPKASNRLISWRLGSSYDVTDRITVFAGYGDSYVPQPGSDRFGAQIDPLRARSVEAGVKTSLFGGKALWTNSLFQITQDHQTICDPIDPVDCKYLILFGNVRMRGLESELIGRVHENLQISAGLSLMDPKIRENGSGYAGNRYPNVPTAQASTFANYRWAAVGLPELSTRLGVIRIGERQANSANNYQLPAYARVDAGAGYAFNNRFSLDFHVENLFDKTYYTSAQDGGSGTGQIGVGNKRLMQVLLRMKM